MSGIDHLLNVASAYANAEGVEFSTVSWRVFGDSKKLDAIRNGKDIQVRRFERAMAWFDEHWPTNVAWPSSAPRPGPRRIHPSDPVTEGQA